jgi:hypothetical protein
MSQPTSSIPDRLLHYKVRFVSAAATSLLHYSKGLVQFQEQHIKNKIIIIEPLNYSHFSQTIMIAVGYLYV